MTEQTSVVVRFTFPATGGRPEFVDALTFTPEEYSSSTPAEREAEKQARYDAWCALLDNPPEPEPTLEVDRDAVLAQLEQDAQALSEQIAALRAQDQAPTEA